VAAIGFSPTGKGLLSHARDRPRVVPDCGQRRHARIELMRQVRFAEMLTRIVSSRTPRVVDREQR